MQVGLQSSFLEEPVMLLAIVLLGRTLEARARLKASGAPALPSAQQNVPCQRSMPHIRRESRSAESLPFLQGSVLQAEAWTTRLMR